MPFQKMSNKGGNQISEGRVVLVPAAILFTAFEEMLVKGKEQLKERLEGKPCDQDGGLAFSAS